MQENDNKGMIAGIIAVLVIVGAVVGFVVLSGSDDATDTATEPVTSEQSENEANEVAQENIVGLAQATPQLSTLVDAIVAAGLVETLSASDAEFTVFAPTNQAFNALPDGTLQDLLKPENKDQLAGILTYHVVEGAVTSDQLSDGQKITTVQGDQLTVRIMDGKVMINGAEVTTADVQASNGVVHIIDTVLLPS